MEYIVFNKLARMLSIIPSNLAIDLGTANTLVYAEGSGVVVNEPSVVAFLKEKGDLIPYAFGNDAKHMLGRTPTNIEAMRPLRDGVIAEFRGAQEMLKHFIRLAYNSKRTLVGPVIIVCVPSGSTPVERKAIQEAAENSGARDVYLIEEPMAAAIGSNLPVTEPTGSMIVDIGGGTTEVAILSLCGVVYSQSIKVGGDAMDEAISSYVKNKYGLLIGETTAELIKKKIGSACKPSDSDGKTFTIKGRDLTTRIPGEVTLTEKEVSESLEGVISKIISAIQVALESTLPELSSDIVDRGIVISGGGSLLHGLDVVLHKATGLPVFLADEPLYSVAYGIAQVLRNMNKFHNILFKESK